MAVSLLTALIALGLLHLQPALAHWRGDGGFRRWVAQLGDASGAGRTVIALAVPVVLCLLAIWLISLLPMRDLVLLVFSLAVLLYCFGPHAYEADLEAILKAPDGVSRQAAVQALSDEGEPIAWNAVAVGEAVAYAVLYRLAQTLRSDATLRLDTDAQSMARRIAHGLDWVPAQLMVFTLALVGHWDAVIGAWRQWHQHAIPGSWLREGPGFLGAAARADIEVDIEAGDGYAEERIDVLGELRRLRGALLRALLAWMSVVALIVLAGWLH